MLVVWLLSLLFDVCVLFVFVCFGCLVGVLGVNVCSLVVCFAFVDGLCY